MIVSEMVVTIHPEDNFQEDGDLIYADEYLGMGRSPNNEYPNSVICRVYNLKFRSHQETQDRIMIEESKNHRK
jgi:hypothetical protein